jgi:hypothetical protein
MTVRPPTASRTVQTALGAVPREVLECPYNQFLPLTTELGNFALRLTVRTSDSAPSNLAIV